MTPNPLPDARLLVASLAPAERPLSRAYKLRLDRHSVKSSEYGSVASESVTAGRPRARRPPLRALAPSATGSDRFADNGRSRLRGPSPLLTSFRAVFTRAFIERRIVNAITYYKHGQCGLRPPAAWGAVRPRQLLPLGEIKSFFIKLLEQQGYAVLQEADDLLEDEVSNNSRQNCNQSPCPSVASSGKRSSSAISLEEVPDQSDTTIKGQEKSTNNLDSPASPDSHITQATVTVPAQATVGVNLTKKAGSLLAPPPKSKLPPPICLRDKLKWNLVAAECTKLRINYTKAQNTKFGIKITVASIEDLRNLNRYLIKNNLPFHTFALE
ncbi:hypothetical protein EVAR_96624_1 [Eumeta japonica]|uniref:Nucleic-acid-binding protein from transposon X-element n=1 Tax=Eumeta variegata TaxID=151549 RepID=A0A4C1WR20_EUMVA|nr:hypothetical protein EVAR_96624_1 [Eumeta japonica]